MISFLGRALASLCWSRVGCCCFLSNSQVCSYCPVPTVAKHVIAYHQWTQIFLLRMSNTLSCSLLVRQEGNHLEMEKPNYLMCPWVSLLAQCEKSLVESPTEMKENLFMPVCTVSSQRFRNFKFFKLEIGIIRDLKGKS